jgi:hypothetical protein
MLHQATGTTHFSTSAVPPLTSVTKRYVQYATIALGIHGNSLVVLFNEITYDHPKNKNSTLKVNFFATTNNPLVWCYGGNSKNFFLRTALSETKGKKLPLHAV